MCIVITGGAGFIGSHFILHWLSQSDELVINLDNLTYAGNLQALTSLHDNSQYTFIKGNIGDEALVSSIYDKYKPRAIINFAAESHVDRSIVNPSIFIETNVVETFHLLQATQKYWQLLPKGEQQRFRFLHVSTDEVFGSLSKDEPPFTEESPYAPNSIYSASKAASDHLARAFHQTHGLPVITTHSSNNYGPRQFPEKLIPLMLVNALSGKTLPIYGNGQQVRDWLYVVDHCRALCRVLDAGVNGKTYNIGARNEKTNIDVVRVLCTLLDGICPRKDKKSYQQQIEFVTDRLGHDKRYAINPLKLEQDLGWRPRETFEEGLLKTVQWYVTMHDYTKAC